MLEWPTEKSRAYGASQGYPRCRCQRQLTKVNHLLSVFAVNPRTVLILKRASHKTDFGLSCRQRTASPLPPMLHFLREFQRKRIGGFVASEQPDQDWAQTDRGGCVSISGQPILRPGAKIFAMGSCFAREIRSALRTRGYDVYPKYFDVDFDPDRQKVGKLPDRDNQNHYTTFSIRQEIERVRPSESAWNAPMSSF